MKNWPYLMSLLLGCFMVVVYQNTENFLEIANKSLGLYLIIQSVLFFIGSEIRETK